MSQTARAARPVLIVDDDVDIRRTLATALIEEGFEVVTACDGRAALDYLKGCVFRPFVILLDLRMPIMDGRAFLAARALDGTLTDIPVIVLTADNASGTVAGASSVLLKPFGLDGLLERLSSLM
jgi:CheY-like chemotaxis protein